MSRWMTSQHRSHGAHPPFPITGWNVFPQQFCAPQVPAKISADVCVSWLHRTMTSSTDLGPQFVPSLWTLSYSTDEATNLFERSGRGSTPCYWGRLPPDSCALTWSWSLQDPLGKSMQISLGLPDPTLLQFSPAQIRLPITKTILEKIHQHLRSSNHSEQCVLWAVASTAFCQVLLQSPSSFNGVIHLTWGDGTVNSPLHQIHPKKSKCDQLWTGFNIVVRHTANQLSSQCHIRV